MERRPGRMYQTHVCSQCGASFSKRSLLDEHKRILGHRNLFSCDICDKTFYRKDNLDSHRKKHDQKNYQRPLCNQAFDTSESLDLHHINHVQTGRGLKRKAAGNIGPSTKRRITKYDNPEDSYDITVIGEQTMPKFKTTSTRYRVIFKELDIRGIPNILRSLTRLFTSILKNMTEFMDSSDLVRMSVQCPELDFPISLPFMKLSQLNTERFLSEIERVLQSYEQFVLDETLDIEIIHVTIPSGGVGKRCKYVDLEKTLHEKKCFIQIQNNDELCCARAIVTAKARIDNHEKWNSIRLGKSIQGILAMALHQKANVPLQRCGVEEIKAFQRVLEGYQIHVLSKDHFNAIVFEGPPAEKKIYLYHHDEHFDIITKMPAFFGRNYYCTKCNKGYDHKERHVCNNVCHCCFKLHDQVQEQLWVYCEDCNRHFPNNACFDMHKQSTSAGQSTCNSYYRCKQCGQTINKKLHERSHQCGEQYCRVCKDYVPEDHQCYMQPAHEESEIHTENSTSGQSSKKEQKNKEIKRLIFFDFECTQDNLLQCEKGYKKPEEGRKCMHCNNSWCGNRQHVPNLCVVHRVCDKCMDDDIDETSLCDLCGKNEIVFEGDTTRDDFCRWLFSEENSGAKVLCHNFKGYVSYPILQYLYQNAILPEVIMTGSKFMSIDVPQCNIRFLDSINFLPMALEKFPKTFGLDELSKGFFPHLYNTRKNQNAVLPFLPDAEYYNPDGMKPDKRNAFFEWYEEHKYERFVMKDELLKYCRSDVDILRKGCLAFRKMFGEITTKDDRMGIDPFEKSITIASACNLVFRRNFLDHETIGIIPANGYNPGQKQSIKALKWLKYLSKRDNVHIRHARNGGEKNIDPYKVDGYQETETGEKIVYEFHGCFWHGCVKCFARSTMNHMTGRTMADLYQRTLDKRTYIERLGFIYNSIWECEFDKEVETNIDLRLYAESMHYVDPLEPRDAFYGGRTEAFTLYKKTSEGDRIDYYDVTSLYPFINKTGKIPVGHPRIITENFEDVRTYEGLIKCKVVPPKNLFLPLLPTKCNGKLLFGLCRVCMESKSTDDCLHNESERALVGTWVTEEIIKALEKGYKVVEIYEVWHFDQISQYDPFTKTGGIFTEYVNTFLKIKQEASGWPEWCKTKDDQDMYLNDYYEKEGIWLDPTKIAFNPGLRQLAKLILNSFWGKFGQRANLPRTTYVKEPAEYFDILTSDEQEVKDVSFVTDEMLRLQWVNKDKFVEESGRTNVVIAAYTTAQARLQLYKYMEKLGERTLYCDTDSIIFISKKGDWMPNTGDFLGDLTDEVPDNSIVSFVTGGPKNYAFLLKNPDKEGNLTCCKIRGITLNYKNSLELNYHTMKEMLRGNKKTVTLTDEHKIRRNVKTNDIITCAEDKDYRIVFDKRILKDDYTTVPYGM